MVQTFFWYDLETTGVNAREGRVMQFAGQRTDMDLQAVGEPVNVLIKLTEDILPDPEAVLITGITPQQTILEGITEAAFLKLFYEQVATPGTIFVGFNTVRFDDEFMRFLHYRNFYDAYEWQYKDGKSRWDLLDLVRMTRALRPEGIKWPVVDGKPTNRLELITKLNGLDHANAHDALNDVFATIAVAQLIKSKQPKLFEWLLNLRSKDAVKKFLQANRTFIYSSGKYANESEKTAVVCQIHTEEGKETMVYDLRVDPTGFRDLSPEELADRWRYTKEVDASPRVPVKTLKHNRCPALSPTGILSDKSVQKRLRVTTELINTNLATLNTMPELQANIVKARDLLDDERAEQWSKAAPEADVALYDGGFFDDNDRKLMSVVHAAQPDELNELSESFHDSRLRQILPHYKARNYSKFLTDEEQVLWEKYRFDRLMEGGTESRLAKYMHRLGELAASQTATEKRYLLEELQLYAESIMPVVDSGQ